MQPIQQFSNVTIGITVTFDAWRGFYAPGASIPASLIRMKTTDSLTYAWVMCILCILSTLCMYADFDKNGTNNWKNIKLSGTLFEHWDKPQTKVQCCSLFRSWVIQAFTLPKNLWGCPLIKCHRTTEKTRNFQEILLNMGTSLSRNFNAVACFFLELFSRVYFLKNCEGVLL